MEIRANNIGHLAGIVYPMFNDGGRHIRHDLSRNGPVLRVDEPVTMMIDNPRQRVSFCPVRDANPFFHLIEAMAMIANVNDAKFLSYFAKNILNYSDDGRKFNAFYGTRLRSHFDNMDQMAAAVDLLKANPESRQVVLQIWDSKDLRKDTKDKACNTQIMFSVDGQHLNMATTNRSNDAIWGFVTGANMVHFPFFQEWVACALDLYVGRWTHFSNNFHIYTDNPQAKRLLKKPLHDDSMYYELGKAEVCPALFTSPGKAYFDVSLGVLVRLMRVVTEDDKRDVLFKTTPSYVQRHPFLSEVLVPMFHAWVRHRRKGDTLGAMELLGDSKIDWLVAGREWLARRIKL